MNTLSMPHPATDPALGTGSSVNAPDAGRGRAPGVPGWPLLLLAAPAFVAIWSGWVGLGDLTGFGVVHPLPGIADGLTLNTAITLPIGVETYAAFALRVWLSGTAPAPARRFARWSALGSLLLGAAGQIAYHLMTAAGMAEAPWQITAAVACLPVAVLGMGAALAHLVAHPAGSAADVDSARAQLDDPGSDAAGGADTGTLPAPGRAVLGDASGSLAGEGAGPRAIEPASGSTSRAPRVGGRLDTRAKVARLRERHPDMTAGEIARRLGVTDRTVRRYIAAEPADALSSDPSSATAGGSAGEEVAA